MPTPHPPDGRSTPPNTRGSPGTVESDLAQVAAALGVTLDPRQLDLLAAYLALLQRWNAVYNLTAVREPQAMLTQHLADSLAVVPPLRRHLAGLAEVAAGGGSARRLLDVGSGGGLPGVVLAIACPELDVSCIDTVAKKANFIRQVAAELRLPNLHAVHGRVEAQAGSGFDVVVSRAFASLGDFTTWSRRALAAGGAWMAMKGKRPDAELAALAPDIEVFHVEPLQVPGLDAERCLVWMRPRAG